MHTLVGKAREIYSHLSVDDSSHYQTVKDAILKSYELVLKAYQQKFCNATKGLHQAHVEFVRHKETLFDRWCLYD